MFTLKEIQELIAERIKKEAGELAITQPENLYLPVEYILNLKGKKLRPVLVLLAYNLFSNDLNKALPAAIAIEIFHNFTLLHDDIMDKAVVRRGQSTVHRKFSENAAILSGDVMAFVSFRYLLQTETKQLKSLLSLYANTAIEVCEGQQYDMDFENRNDVSESEYLEMIRLKTAVLLGCSLKSGALIAEKEDKTASILYDFGVNMGMAFQLQDDLLDSFGDETTFGKKIGGDIIANKKTFLLVKAFELANPQQKEKLDFWMNQKLFNPEEKIREILSIYNDLGIKSLTQNKSKKYHEKAITSLNAIPVDKNKKEQLEFLAQTMLNRKY